MNPPVPNDPELDALLGAYALDALEPDERARVDEYVSANARARDEVDELRESAASLALAPVDDATAPPELWDRISRTIERELASEADFIDETEADELATRRVRRGPTSGRWLSIAAIAAAIVGVVLVGQVISLHQRLNDARVTGERDAVAAFTRARHTAGAREVELTAARDGEVARVVLLPDGSGYVKNDRMSRLDAEHTYQLWALTGTGAKTVAISAGVLGSHPKAASFRTAGSVEGFAITVERVPGVPQSAQKPYASANLT